MKPSQTFRPSSYEKWITTSIWALALLLIFNRPLQISLFKLNIEIFMFSTFGLTWAFLLVCLLVVPQIDLIMMYLETYRVRFPPHYLDPMRTVMLWTTPLTFFCLPGAPIVRAWLDRDRFISAFRALRISLVIFGILYIPFGLILNQSILKYTQP